MSRRASGPRYFLKPVSLPLIMALAWAPAAAAQSDPSADSTVVHKTTVTAFPYVYYTPETRLAFGVGGILAFYTGRDAILRPSKVTLSGYYTTTAQYLVTLNSETYLTRNKVFTGLKLSLGHFVDKFYGIGPSTPDLGTEQYVMDRYGIKGEVQIPPILFVSDRAGLIYEYEWGEIVDPRDNPYVTSDTIPGTEGGAISGLGGIWVWDTRDHTFWPTGGELHRMQFMVYTSSLGSHFSHWTYELDDRRYWSLSARSVLAFQMYVSGASGDVPFYRLPALGGQRRMRGYYEGRYRDHSYLMSQVEYRQDLWRRLGFVAFLAVGDVAADVTKYQLLNLKVAYGAGLRFLFNRSEKINLRVDIGLGKHTSGLYFGLEEAY